MAVKNFMALLSHDGSLVPISWYSLRMTQKDRSTSLDEGRTQQKERTRRLLLETAAGLLAAGQRPSVSEVADAAMVSRRTAYRYFPSVEKLHADAALDNLRPIMEAAIQTAAASGDPEADAELHIDALVKQMQRLALDNEKLLRTMIHETVLQTPGKEDGPQRGARRLEWIKLALKPLEARIGSSERKRLVNAIALCTGIEALLVFRDVCGLSEGEAIRVGQWMCRTLLKETLKQSEV
jgi:AcrR family transcriptional regulator